MGIHKKTIAIYLFFFLVPFVVIGLFSYQSGKKEIEKTLGGSFQRIAYEASDKIDRHIYFNVYHRAKTWSELPLLQDVLTGDPDGNITTFFTELTRNEKEFSSIIVTDKKGIVVASNHIRSIGLGLSEEPFFQNTVYGVPHMQDISQNNFIGIWGLQFSFPIRSRYQKNTIIGALSITWGAEYLDEFTKDSEIINTGRIGDIYVIRNDGFLISGPGGGITEPFEINELLIANNWDFSEKIDQAGHQIETDGRGNSYLIGYAPSSGFREYPGFGWAVFVIKNAETIFKPVDRLKYLIFTFGGLIALMGILFSSFTARRATQPIMLLDAAARRVSKGDFDVQVSNKSRDELGSLTDNFNRMVMELKERQSQLEKSTQQSNSIIQNIMNALFVINDKEDIQTVNRAALRMLDYSEKDLIGKPISYLFQGQFPDGSDSMEEFIGKDNLRDLEGWLWTKDGLKIPVVFWGTRISGENKFDSFLLAAQDMSERHAQNAMLEYRATHDLLTDLPGRNLLQDRLEQAIMVGKRIKHPVSLLILNIDRFRQVNESFGYRKGDLLLKKMGPILREVLRESDTIAKLAGDEFAVMMPKVNINGAVNVANKILKAMVLPFEVDKLRIDIEVSIGISVWPDHANTASELMQNADVAMYVAKKEGSGHTVFNPAKNRRKSDRIKIFSELRQAINREELMLYFQPKIDLKKLSFSGVEALIRWNHSTEGMIAPDRFIPMAEKTGLVHPLSLWVLNSAIRQAKIWYDGHKGVPIAVNLSARNLQDPSLSDHVNEFLNNWGLPSRYLEVEITESAIMADTGRAYEILFQLHERGVKISLDDFGTGYTSLGYLKQLPIDSIKIDKSFIKDMVRSGDDLVIVRAIIDLAHDLSLNVVAEGVEDKETFEKLIELGCDQAQGYFMGRPVTVEVLRQWFRESPYGAKSNERVLDIESL